MKDDEQLALREKEGPSVCHCCKLFVNSQPFKLRRSAGSLQDIFSQCHLQFKPDWECETMMRASAQSRQLLQSSAGGFHDHSLFCVLPGIYLVCNLLILIVQVNHGDFGQVKDVVHCQTPSSHPADLASPPDALDHPITDHPLDF